MSVMRREFLTKTAQTLSVVPFLAMTSPATWGDLVFEPDSRLVPAKPLPPNPFVKGEKALVVLVHGQNPEEMVRIGMQALGGIGQLGLEGKRVLIKPNVVNNRPPPTTTNPDLVAAVVKMVRASNPSEVIVADSSGVIRFPTRENLIETGIRQAAERAGAKVLALEEEPWVKVAPEKAKILEYYFVSQPLYDAEIIINLPVIKTHRFANYSCCLKNAVGIVHPRNRPSVTFLAGNWHERIAELNLAVHPLLNIADGTTMMIAGGPTSGTPAQANLILLSGDRIALDAVALSLIRYHRSWEKVTGQGIWEQRQIKKAIELGLGIQSNKQIELVTRSVGGSSPKLQQFVEFIKQDIGI